MARPTTSTGGGGAAATAAATGLCGPDVTKEFAALLSRIQADFRGWSEGDKKSACRRILYPLKRPQFSKDTDVVGNLRTMADIDGWDTLPLYQGASQWLRSAKVLDCGCATPSSTNPGADAFDDVHEDPATCSDSVQIGGQCWLNGTVNYGTYGVMVRLCADEFWEFKAARLEAVALIKAYKKMGGHPEAAEDPLRWFNATYSGGPTAIPSGAGNRPNCDCKCSLNGSIVSWDYVWEPKKPRTAAAGPNPDPT